MSRTTKNHKPSTNDFIDELYQKLHQCYGAEFIKVYGERPTKEFCDIIENFSVEQQLRALVNLDDRVERGAQNVPSLKNLIDLSQRPTSVEIAEALTTIYYEPKTRDHQTEAQRRFMDVKYQEIDLNAASFKADFEVAFIEAWRDVHVNNVQPRQKALTPQMNPNIKSTYGEHLSKSGQIIVKNHEALKNEQDIRLNKRYQHFSFDTIAILNNLGHEMGDKVLKFWEMMCRAYGAGMRATYGTEPDHRFIELACDLTVSQMERVADNIHDLLLHQKTFPPAYESLRMLSQRPTRAEINTAKRDLYDDPKPLNKLSRVDRYIKKNQMGKIRKLQVESFMMMFEKLYVDWYRDVMVNNIDHIHESRQRQVAEAITHNKQQNAHEKRIVADLNDGTAFDHKLGNRIARLLSEQKKKSKLGSDE